MHTIEIDDEVFAHLQGHAIPYIETPNHTIRRLLFSSNSKDQGEDKVTGHVPVRTINKRVNKVQNVKTTQTVHHLARGVEKARKARLCDLTSANILREGQILYLYDYHGKRVPSCEAKVAGQNLIWNGGRYSMSDLAKRLLKEQGYQSDSVRGPAHWFTADGISVMALWAQYLSGSK